MNVSQSLKGMKIACVNYEPITLYREKGWSSSRLGEYYNPDSIAEQVYVFAYRDRDWQMPRNVRVTGWRSFTELEEKCKAFRPDVIRCYEAFRPFTDYSLAIALSLGIPSYLSLHDGRVKYYSRLKYFTTITAYTETLAIKAQRQLGRNVETQLNGIDSRFFCPKVPSSIDPRIASAKYRVFTVTREDPVKNTSTALEATGILARKFKSVAHVIAGSGSERIDFDGVHLGLGHLSEEMMIEYLNWCNCFLQVQLVSDIGMAVSEALMIGRPVIVTGDSMGNAQSLIDEEKGILIPADKVKDAQFVADALIRCLGHQYDCEKIRKWAVEMYDIERLGQKEAERYVRLHGMKHRAAFRNKIRGKLLVSSIRMELVIERMLSVLRYELGKARKTIGFVKV